jgi:TRAP-type C4-dicarboxylate transport system permease small subunit
MKRVEQAIGRMLRTLAAALFVGVQLLMAVSVFNRFFPFGSLDWSDEILELMLVWLIFCGTAEVWRIRQHFHVEIVPLMLKARRYEHGYRIAIMFACFLFIAIFTNQSFDLCMRAGDLSPYFSWPRRLWYASMPFAGALMALFSLRELYELLVADRKKAVVAAQRSS